MNRLKLYMIDCLELHKNSQNAKCMIMRNQQERNIQYYTYLVINYLIKT